MTPGDPRATVPAEGEIRYDTDTVKVIRGTENRTIAKREAEGWELVRQIPGTVRTELIFRRPKPRTPWRLYVIVGGAFVALMIFVGIMAAITGADDIEPSVSPISTSEASAPINAPSVAPEENRQPEATPEPPAEQPALEHTTVDDLLDRLNSADMGGVETGDRFALIGELFMSELWMIGATGDYFVMFMAQGGAQDLLVFVDESLASSWTDGTKVEAVLEAVDATIDGETTSGWLRVFSATVIP